VIFNFKRKDPQKINGSNFRHVEMDEILKQNQIQWKKEKHFPNGMSHSILSDLKFQFIGQK
jgi:hypothetical protein